MSITASYLYIILVIMIFKTILCSSFSLTHKIDNSRMWIFSSFESCICLPCCACTMRCFLSATFMGGRLTEHDKWSPAGLEGSAIYPESCGLSRKSYSLCCLKMILVRNPHMYCSEMKLVLEDIFGNYSNKETSFKIGILEKIKQIFIN